MALDAQLAERLWEQRYQDETDRVARKNAYLSDFKDPEDLAQDMAINVWMKAVNAFDPKKTTFAGGDVERAFNAFYHQIMSQYLASLATHKDTGKQKWQRSQTSLDKPVGGEGSEEGGATFLDMLESGDTGTMEEDADFQKMLHALPEELAGPVKYIVDNLTPGNKTEIMKDIRDKWGLTERRLYNALINEPEFLEYVNS